MREGREKGTEGKSKKGWKMYVHCKRSSPMPQTVRHLAELLAE